MEMKAKKRDISCDVIKAVTSLCVVFCHVNFYFAFSEGASLWHDVLSAVFADEAGIFFLAAGFFLYNNTDYLKLLKKSAIRVALPGFAMMIITQLFFERTIGPEFILSVLTFRETGIYWFVYAYLWVMIFFPFFKGAADFLNEGDSDKKYKIFMIVTFILLIINDCFKNSVFGFSFEGLTVMIPAGLETLWGMIVYKMNERFKERKVAFAAAAGFAGVTAVRVILIRILENYGGGGYLRAWETSFGFVCASLFCIFVISLTSSESASSRASVKLVADLGTYAYTVYLVHPFILRVAKDCGLFETLKRYNGNPVLYYVALYLAVGIVAYMAALAISAVLRKITNIIKGIFNK